MKSFTLKLLVYFLPFVTVFGLIAGWLTFVGETMPLSQVVAIQSGDAPALYRPRYGYRDPDFKLLATDTRGPEVLALGSSRVLQFRSLFFNRNPRVFYNAGFPAAQLTQVKTFVEQMQAVPRILILGLDPPWFNPNYVEEMLSPSVSDGEHLLLTTRGFLQNILAGAQFDFARISGRREPLRGGLALGMRAILDGHGFRNDGSEQYGDFLVAHYLSQDQQRDHHLGMMRQGEKMYVRGDQVSEAAVHDLDTVLQLCRERGIYVIGLSPPFAPTLYSEMLAGGQHTYIPQLTERFYALFNQYGFAYFDFSDATIFGAKDADFFDGWHASELAYLLMYIRMVETIPDILGPYSDTSGLYQVVAGAADTFDVFGDRF